MNKNQSLLFRKGAGSSQLNLSKKEVINFLIFSTSRNEQDKVSLIFNNINSLITLHQRGISEGKWEKNQKFCFINIFKIEFMYIRKVQLEVLVLKNMNYR
ncbi:hypothetical protein ONA22_02425 [Mycoplasmopsis cynos]|uniref:hypothetical protein n=2 Tax=Mycoplasmopsis cynos TaxID=171284 RepID=UPI0024CCD3EF|nr:hypothetical protein [Mycoplasmopsis cynos]WAM04135.1 hypothetical protein ONA22_02425 [Mycoplasmopsis cynos]